MNKKPTVLIYEDNAPRKILAEICAGLEEEGLLYDISKRNSKDVKTLAYDAAAESILKVGIGVTSESADMQIKNCHIDKPIFLLRNPSKSACRSLGANSARAVKGGIFL